VFTSYLPGVNLAKCLSIAFTCAYPKSVKDKVFSVHLESACVKAACKMLVKLTPDSLTGCQPGVNFIYILRVRFSYESALTSFL